MRVFNTLQEAQVEIRRDIYKGTPLTSSRVQHRSGEVLPGRERLMYQYSLLGGIPETAQDLVRFGMDVGFPLYVQHPDEMREWLEDEKMARLFPEDHIGSRNDEKNPALAKVKEGNWPSYTYPERLVGAMPALEWALQHSPDSRRAYWPIYRPEDAIRAGAPTRIPCSLGYEAIIRRVGNQDVLMLIYIERSCDFDHFWLSDVWLARQFQLALATNLGYWPGQLVHSIISFHSFAVENTEVY